MKFPRTLLFPALVLTLLASIDPAVSAEDAASAANTDNAVAVVEGQVIEQAQFVAYFNQARRQEFYHRTPPPGELEAFRIKTLQELIDRILLRDEAVRRGLEPDGERIDAEIARITSRYEGSPEWEAGKEIMTASLQTQLEAGSLLEQVEQEVRDVGQPDEEQLRVFFEANPDTFTEPEQRRVSLILVELNPSALQAEREEALAQAEALAQRLRSGEDFALLAEAYSADPSGEDGGDMGWLHVGLLNDQAEAALGEMQPGDISDPVRTLEGYAILRLDEVKAPEKKTLDEVRDRAIALWQREEGERSWQALKETLRAEADIQILDPSLEAAAGAGSG